MERYIGIVVLLTMWCHCFAQNDTLSESLTWKADMVKVKEGKTTFCYTDIYTEVLPGRGDPGTSESKIIVNLADRYASVMRDTLLYGSVSVKEVFAEYAPRFRQEKANLSSPVGRGGDSFVDDFDVRKVNYVPKKFGFGADLGFCGKVPFNGNLGSSGMVSQINLGLDFDIGRFFIRPGIAAGFYKCSSPYASGNISEYWIDFGYSFFRSESWSISAFVGPSMLSRDHIINSLWKIFWKTSGAADKNHGVTFGLSADYLLGNRVNFMTGNHCQNRTGLRLSVYSDLHKDSVLDGIIPSINVSLALTVSHHGIKVQGR